MADRRVGMWGTDTATPNALSTSNKRKAAMKDIMSSMSKRHEIKPIVKDVLRSRVDYATRGDLDFSKDDLVRAMLEPSINIGHLRGEMHLGMPGGEEYVTKNLTSPKSEHVNARYSVMTGESAAMKRSIVWQRKMAKL